MNQKFKSGKKVLSLVLSVLMLMSCLVFAPVANAAETLPKSDVVITIKVTNEMVLESNNGTFTMTLQFADGTSKVINLFGYDEFTESTKINSADWINEKTTIFTIKDVTAKLTDIYMDMSINKYFDFGIGIQGKLVFNLTATQNGETIGTYKFSSRGDMDNHKYILGGNSGNTITASTASGIQFTEMVEKATIDNGNATAQFKAVVVDQFGVAMSGKTVTYSVSPTAGASIKPTGLATFNNKATTNAYNRNTYTVTAKNGTLSATATIYVTNEQFDVTFKYPGNDGTNKEPSQKVYYGKAATAPTDYAAAYSTADGHMTFTKWDKAFNSVTSDLTVNAVYSAAAHNFVSKADVAVSGDKATGYTVADSETFECSVGKETKTEPVDLTGSFNAAASAACEILDESEKYNTESAAYKALESAYSELVGLVGKTWKSETIEEKIAAVNAAVEAFNKALADDPAGNYKTYTLTYIINGTSETENYYFGQTIVKRADPSKEGYTFNGWDGAVPETMPATNVTVTATWKTIDYTGTLKGVHGVNDGYYTISYTVEDNLENLIADANAAIPEESKSFVATASDAGYDLDYTYTLSSWTPEKGAGYAGDQTFTAVYKKGDFNYANYEKWNAAVAEATEKILNSEKYSDESKAAVQAVIDSILPDQGISYQPTIDAAIENLNAKVKEIEDNAPASYKKLTVSFDLAGGTAAPAIASQEVYYGYKATTPVVVPTKTGYDFAGWDFDFETAITKDTTVTAKWTVATYKVTFVYENGDTFEEKTFNYINAETGAANSIDVIKAIAPAVPEKTGFTGYWNFDKVTFTAADLVVEPTYAANTYTISFYQFKSDETPVAEVEYEFGATSITEPDFPDRKGYTGKWGSYTLGASDSDVYAEYTPITYTAKYFDENNNLVGTRTYTIESTSVTDPAAPTKDGYNVTWPDWYKANMIGDTTVKAVYTPRNDISVAVTMKSESGKLLGTKVIENQTMDTTISVAGDSFAGYTAPAAVDYKVKASGNAVELIYALNTYTATYVADGKTVGTYEFNVETSKDEIAKAVAVPAKEGYTGAWKAFDVKAENITVEATYDTVEYTASFIDDNGKSEVKFTVESTKEDVLAEAGAPAARDYYTVDWDDFAIVAGNITVNAVYTPVDFTANFVDENGNSCGTVTFNVETASVVNPAAPTKDGYTVTWPDWFTPGMHENTTVIAVYKANKYKATFNDENDKFVGEVEYTVEDSVEAILAKAPAVPAKVGYEPGEWVLDNVVSGNMTIKPVYNTLTVFKATFYKLDGSVAKVVNFTIENTASDIKAQAPELETVPGYVTSWTTVTVDVNAPKNLTINTQKLAVPYTATFNAKKDGGVEEKFNSFDYTVESDKAALEASIGTPAAYMDGDYQFKFTGWDKAFDLYVGDTTYTAQYDEGTFVPAKYAEFDKAEAKAGDIIKNNDLTQEVIDKINDLIADGYKEDGSDYGITDQQTVDDATKALNDYLNSLDKNNDSKVDEDNLKHYDIRFFSEGKQVGETQSLIKGATVAVPANPTKAADEHKTYQFKGWSPDVTEVTGDQDYVAEYNSIDYTEYDKVVDILDNADLTDDVKEAVEDIKKNIDGDRAAEPEDKNTQTEVDAAVEELKKLLDGENVKDENLNHYTVIFNYKDKNANDVTDDSNKDLLKGAKVNVPAVEKSFEVKTADSDKTYVFTGWDPADVEANVTKSADHTAQYKVVEYKDFNDLVDDIDDIDLNDETKKEIEDIINNIEDKKNDEDGDKNTQKDVNDAINGIKNILDKDGDGEIDEDVLKKYTVTFKWHGGEESQTVVSGKAAFAPAEFVKSYYDTAKHYTFSKWDADFAKVTADLTVNAVYTGEAHKYSTSIARPEAKDGAKGTVTYTCECGYSYTVPVDRADYSRYDAAVEKLNEILDTVDLTDEARKSIMDMLKNNDIEDNLVDAKDNGYDEQPIVDAAADALELFLEELNKKIDDNDPEVIKYYTVKFNWHNGSSEKKYVKGATVAVPTVESYVYGGFTYEFTGWDKAVVAVDGDAEYNAQYTEPRSMDDVIEAEKKADDIIGNKDYYEEDRNAVEDAKKELDEYLDEKGVEIDENGNVINNPIAKDSEEDEKITELVQKLNDAINTANKNKEERDKAFNKTGGFLGWLTRLLILVRHLLNMV